MPRKVAILDLGTNTFHLLIADWDGSRYRITYRDRVAVKIGMGGINQGIITADGIDRAVSALLIFKTVLEQKSVTSVRAFGTSALRSAKNGKEVVSILKNKTGFDINVISGDEEAGYIYTGVREAMELGIVPSLIVDIGGGSVEFIIGNQEEIFWKHSFDIGAQRLLEKFHQQDPIRPEEVSKLMIYLESELQPLHEQIEKFKPDVLVGSSGTFDTLSDIHILRSGITIEPEATETPLTIEAFEKTYEELLTINRSERLLIPGMIEMRVDMIVTACCIIQYLLDTYEIKRIRVSTYSLREGVLSSKF